METIILICLLLIIILLLHDRFDRKNYEIPNKGTENRIKDIDDIMGPPKTLNNHYKEEPTVPENHKEVPEDSMISEAESEMEAGTVVDFEAEEEEWRNQSYFFEDAGLAEGVTFEELQSFTDYVQSDHHENVQNNQLLATAKKIQGTELFSLLESSVEGASKRIAELLDSTLHSTQLQVKESPDQFNIQNYL
ncbi:conjugal transfer protein TraD [Pedobacter sp. KLB.chiD]|uniref:conjugal transfer protein TraD n=1 Tax=Pedobacter sp. KLB.chiD TaxID=3387402 RepID=UPI00399A3329